MVFTDFEQCLQKLSANPMVNEIFIIGGSALFELALNKYKQHCKLVIMTRVNKDYECDVFMPKGLEEESIFTKMYISKTYSHKDITYDFCFYGNQHLLHKHP